MTKTALYLKYRPGRFADLTGQDAITAALTSAVARQAVGHAYLFSGPRGTGKTTTARLLAKAVNCEHPKQGEPDTTCASCQAVADGTALDVIEIDAASNRGIDEIRQLRENVRLAPTRAAHKIYIIDEVHMLTKEAFNALLKTLEEPPEHVIFILATTEPEKVPATVASRCQRFAFRPAAADVITKFLTNVATREKLQLTPEAAELLAKHARGSFRDALSVLDVVAGSKTGKITAESVRDALGLAPLAAVAELERALATADAAAALRVLTDVAAGGVSPEAFRISLIEYLRLILRAKVGALDSKSAAALAADWELPELTHVLAAYLATGESVATPAAELPLELTTLELISWRAERHSSTPPTETAPGRQSTEQPRPATSPAAQVKPQSNPAADTTAPPDAAGAAVASASRAGDASALWQAIVLATKDHYSLSLCLQKTRPLALTNDTLSLAVESDFFLQKLNDAATREKIEAAAQEHAGRSITVTFSLAEADDVFADALQVFEGAEVE